MNLRSYLNGYSSIMDHISDLLEIIKYDKENFLKNVICLIVDNGPHYSPASYMNIYYYGMLWLILGID